jgi:nitroreductase
MEFAEVVRRRKMIRAYDPDRPIPPEIVQRLLDNAVHAPSAGFSQGWAFLVLQAPMERQEFWAAATPQEPTLGAWLENMSTAPLIIVALSNKSVYLSRYAEDDKGWTDRDEVRWPVPYWDIDTGMASLLILLTAVDEGLGACFFGIPPDRVGAFRAAFDVPPQYMPIGAITVGYRRPDKLRSSARRGRRPMDEVVHYGRFTHERASLDPAG